MFGTFGNVTFELLTSPQAFRSARKYDYAEHKAAQARPKLQWLSRSLEELSLELFFHVSFCSPGYELSLLYAAAASHRAYPLVLGAGEHLGLFVVTEIQVEREQTDQNGAPISLTVNASFKEWAQAQTAAPGLSAAPPPAAPPPAIVAMPPGSGAASTAPAPLASLAGAAGAGVSALPYPGLSALMASAAPAGLSGPLISPDAVTLQTILRAAL